MTVDSDIDQRHRPRLRAGQRRSGQHDADLQAVEAAIFSVCDQLAEQIARDGEGASKLITITVEGAETPPLRAPSGCPSPTRRSSKPRLPVKTPTGAVVMAVGKAVKRRPRPARHLVRPASGCEWGLRDPGHSEDGLGYMTAAEIDIRVDIGSVTARRGAYLRPDPRLHQHQRGLSVMTANRGCGWFPKPATR